MEDMQIQVCVVGVSGIALTCVLIVSSSGATQEEFESVSSSNMSNHVLTVALSPVVSFKIFNEIFDGKFEKAMVL